MALYGKNGSLKLIVKIEWLQGLISTDAHTIKTFTPWAIFRSLHHFLFLDIEKKIQEKFK